jgi:hypothetical protein
MPDGSGKPSIQAEAAIASAEAAREAKAEVLERARTEVTPAAAPKTTGRGRKRTEFHEFFVDVWLTDLNSVEFGFYKHSRNKAKSRQFTSDMDIFAEIIENGERTGLLGYREDLWKKKTGMDKRLVFKLFGEKLNWRGTMDLMLGRSLQLTIGAHGLPVTAFAINLGDYEFVAQIERSAHKWPMCPEDFSFFLVEGGRPMFYRLRQDFIDLGGDYTLYDEQDHAIGRLNGHVFTLGGKWSARVRSDRADPRLLSVLKLFCGMLAFNRPCRRHLRQLAREVEAGRLIPKLETQEQDLYMNPRRVR